jgi:nickel superoxide dismutase
LLRYFREIKHRYSALEGEKLMKLFQPKTVVLAHCDLPCGVYDPAQAKIEALSVKACMEKYAASSDADFKSRSVAIKEERSHQVKEHLWVLWTDYFKPNHFEAYPQLHTLFNDATKLAGAAGTKGTNDVAVADKLIAKIDEIAEIFWATKK